MRKSHNPLQGYTPPSSLWLHTKPYHLKVLSVPIPPRTGPRPLTRGLWKPFLNPDYSQALFKVLYLSVSVHVKLKLTLYLDKRVISVLQIRKLRHRSSDPASEPMQSVLRSKMPQLPHRPDKIIHTECLCMLSWHLARVQSVVGRVTLIGVMISIISGLLGAF